MKSAIRSKVQREPKCAVCGNSGFTKYNLIFKVMLSGNSVSDKGSFGQLDSLKAVAKKLPLPKFIVCPWANRVFFHSIVSKKFDNLEEYLNKLLSKLKDSKFRCVRNV